MSLDSLLSVPCELLRRSAGQPDRYNDAAVVETAVPSRCYWEAKRTAEADDTGATEVAHVLVFLPADVDLTAVDAVRIQGGPTVEAFGVPELRVNARTGRVHHVELTGRETA